MLQFHTTPYFQILQTFKWISCRLMIAIQYDYNMRLVNNNVILIIDTFMLTVSLWTERDISGVWMEFPFFSMHSFNHFESSRTWQWVQISRRCLLRLWLMMVMLRAHGLASSKVHRTEIRNEIVLLNLVYERSADSLCR